MVPPARSRGADRPDSCICGLGCSPRVRSAEFFDHRFYPLSGLLQVGLVYAYSQNPTDQQNYHPDQVTAREHNAHAQRGQGKEPCTDKYNSCN